MLSTALFQNLKFGDEEEVDNKRLKLYKENFKPLVDWLKELYGEKVIAPLHPQCSCIHMPLLVSI
jgi:hypothetical protein